MVTTAPMVARGKVFVGLANGDIGGQGRVLALDAATGEVAWTFFVVPRPGEFGHETWPQDSDSWEYGGGGVWLVGTVDPDLGMVYFSTGNPVPMFGGELRDGDNLFTASVLALDMETGERRWHYQVVRHDIWDADIATPLLPLRHHRRRRAGQGGGGDARRRLPVPVQPRDRRAAPAHRGARGAAGPATAHGADPAVPDPDRDHPLRVLVLARPGAAAVPAQLQQLHAAVGRRADGGGARGCRFRSCG